jgi:hypothetical protein
VRLCNVEGCTNHVFGHGYCKYHQYYRTDLKKKIYTKKIKPVSDKRAKQLAVYSAAKEIAWQRALITGNTKCFICDKIMKFTPDWHHLDGREEKQLLDYDYLVFVHRSCHSAVHNMSYDILKYKPWYDGYLLRLKNIDPILYDKEYAKRYKVENTAL